MLVVIAVLIGAQPIDCRDPQDQTSMNICAQRGYEEADAELNRVWPQVLRRAQQLDRDMDGQNRGEAERRLRAAQRAWVAFRDAHCQAMGLEALGGSMERMLIGGCLKTETERRMNELLMLLAEHG